MNGRFLSQHTLNNLLQNISYQSGHNNLQQFISNTGTIVNYVYKQQHQLAISIAQELACCNELIAAHNGIHQSNIQIHLEVEGTDLYNKIAPFSLAVLVENALKYGFVQSDSQQININISSNYFSMRVSLSGYDLPQNEVIKYPKMGHGLYSLKNRLSYFNHYFGCNYLKAIQIEGNELVLSIAKTSA